MFSFKPNNKLTSSLTKYHRHTKPKPQPVVQTLNAQQSIVPHMRLKEKELPFLYSHPRATEFLNPSVGREVHVLRGFSFYRPSERVINAICTRVHETVQDDESFPTQYDSFFVIDLQRVRYKYRVWKRHLPDVKPHYAVKANPNPSILRLMAHDLNMNFDCASQSEIHSIISLGVAPERIVYANPCKPLSHIDYARRKGVLRTTFDSESELHKIKMVGSDKPWQLILRIWVDDKEAQCQLSNKYGAHVEEGYHLLRVAKELGLDVIGISFHVGSGAKSSSYAHALHDSQLVFKAGLDMGHPMSLLDIGGGYPGTCAKNPKEGPSLSEITGIMRPQLKQHWNGVELIAEPGRFFCAEAQTLATQIIGKRVRGVNGSSINEYYINDGLYQSFNCMLYDHGVLLDEKYGDEPSATNVTKFRSAIFGQTCDGLDQISKDIMLPELRVGDWLAVPNMGAYTNGASSQFNGFPLNDSIVLK